MDTQAHDLLRKLAAVEPLLAPAGEPGVTLVGEAGGALYIPVLSVYLDWRPEATGERPGLRAARVLLRARLRHIERMFWPRGAAYDAVRADADRIERYLDEQASPSAEGLAIFACGPLGLFEILEAGAPFETEVSALATPNLYQLARLLDDQETAIVAVVDSSAARLFVSERGLLRELKGLAEDPKYFRMMKGAVAMGQAHYQRYALEQRRRFANDVSQRLRDLVDETGATQIILTGDDVATAELREALAPDIAAITSEARPRMDIGASRDAVWEEVEPMAREAEAERERSVVERLLDEALADRLGIVGLEQTRAALEAGEAHTLALLADAPLTPETRSQLIALATTTGARVEIVTESPELERLGGVGALLRYRVHATRRLVTPPMPEPPEAQPTV